MNVAIYNNLTRLIFAMEDVIINQVTYSSTKMIYNYLEI